MKTMFFRGLRIMTVAITTLLLGRMTGLAQSHEKSFLKRYDLSTTVINPDTAPTDEIYSWWTETAKKEWINYGNEPKDDRWLHRPEPLGFRGDNFQRFYIHFDTVYKVSPTVYRMEARSRCKDEICHIHGRILIDSVVTFDECDVVDDVIKKLTECGTVYAHYEMEASVGSMPVARLFGRSSYGYLVHNDSVYYDAMMIVADEYNNNQYAGKWVDLVTNDTLTCNWGDFRIPESKELDGGCGLFIPGEDYYNLGWKPYLDWDNHAYVGDPLCMYYNFLYSIDEDWWKYEAEPDGKAPKVEGHYDYAHAFNYDLNGAHLEVHETGTMDFHPDGTVLDSARQVYTATLQDGKTVTYVFNYVSPSKWRLEGEDFYFAGIKESFRMELVESDKEKEDELAQEIIKVVSGSIDYEYKFHLDTLTEKKLQWSFTYRDGHTDTWEFYRKSSRK